MALFLISYLMELYIFSRFIIILISQLIIIFIILKSNSKIWSAMNLVLLTIFLLILGRILSIVDETLRKSGFCYLPLRSI